MYSDIFALSFGIKAEVKKQFNTDNIDDDFGCLLCCLVHNSFTETYPTKDFFAAFTYIVKLFPLSENKNGN